MTKESFEFYVDKCKSQGMSNLAIAKWLAADSYIQEQVSVTGWRSRIDRYLKKKEGTVEITGNKPLGVDVYTENETENETVTDTNQYEKEPAMSARKPDGTIMTPEEYCIHYGLPADLARTVKLVTHTGVPRYNIASRVLNEASDELMTVEQIRDYIKEGIDCYRYVPPVNYEHGRRIGVIKISDLHFGAYIDGLIKTKVFSIQILADMLNETVRIINAQNFEEVYVHIHGDLIESFTGLNHKNSWKGLQKSMIGAEVIKLCTTVLHKEFLSKIDNLQNVKIVAGNHDRVTSDKNEDTDGDAASLIAWGLELMGYEVEFNPLVITHVVDGISYVILHGDKALSKKSTKSICWDYGTPGMFNLVAEGHLHAQGEKLPVAKEEIETVKDDAIDHIRMVLRSFFTGNSFSEHLGYTSNAGFAICVNNGKGVPNVYQFAI